ncbi:PKD domain-containing protein [Cellulomonas sp. NS3]|uniref:PKD domain-containing protein n=1 Tax=Cellulomonas sp. NS3 TaxID=2973977 RepID=UPI0021619BBC|nr:PKD domain-containing protein [Cellulomonas sp. NS3]
MHVLRAPRRAALAAATLTLAVAALLAGPPAGPAAAATSTSASDALTPSTGLLWGAHVADSAAADAESAVQGFEARIGRKLDLTRFYSRWNSPMPPQPVTSALAHGRTPVWSISPQTTSGTKHSWASIAAGTRDADIVAHARAVASLGAPVFLVFQHEPDYATGYGTPAEYRAAYRHYVEVFRAQGVTNVAWAWILTPGSFWATPSTAGADAYYPGDDVVDWLGLDPYNWFGCMAGGPTSWRPLAESVAPFHAWAAPHGKPLMLAEWGSVEDPDQPGRKATWWTEAMTTLAAYPEFKAALAFDAVGNCSWLVDSSESSLASFVAAGHSPAAHGRASAWLGSSTVQGAAPLPVAFDASRSTGTGRSTGSGVTSWTLAFGDGTSASGTGQPPASTTHTYAAGTWTATLTVRDATGSTSTDTRRVVAAAAPTVSASESDLTATSVTLKAWVGTHGEAGTATFEWGTTTAYGNRATSALLATGGTQAVSQKVTGLPSGATVHVRITATTPGGSTVVTRKLVTPGLPTFGWTTVSGRTTTAAKVSGGINPRGLTATTWVEYGTTTALGSTAAGPALAALTYEKGVDVALAGLSPRTTYYYRLAAANTAGTSRGPISTFTTLG